VCNIRGGNLRSLIEKLSSLKTAKTTIGITFGDQQPHEQNCKQRCMDFLNKSDYKEYITIKS